jgi:hypothetical protein
MDRTTAASLANIENPLLDEKLKTLESLRLSLPDVIAKYSPSQDMGMMVMVQNPFETINKLSQADRSKVMNGTAEERTAVLDAMEPEMRARVLAALPPNVAAYTPKYKDEAEKVRKAMMEERQAQNRKRNPQLRDLLTPDQIADVRSGERDRILGVLTTLDPDKRFNVVGQLPPISQAAVPEYRREGQLRRTPRLVASEDLKEGRVMRAVYSNRQLEEVLVDFWLNHFNVDATKNVGMTRLGPVILDKP